MPSQETVLVDDDTRIVDSNDTTNISEEEEEEDDDTVYIDLTKEDTEQSICITLIHVHERGLTDERFEEYKCILDANTWTSFRSLHCELTTWDTRDDLEFKFPDGEVLTNGETTTSKTPSELNMKDGDEIYAQGNIVSREDISVNFMDEDGDVITLCVNLRDDMHHLFEQYSAKKKMSLLLGRLIFHYSKQDGVPINTHCQNSLAYMGISSGDTIHVVRRLPPPEDLDNIAITDEFGQTLIPESLVGQRILMNEGKSQGTIIDTLYIGIKSAWVVEYADGRTCQHTIEDIREGMQRYYNNGGVGNDCTRYFKGVLQKLKSDLEHLGSQIEQQQSEFDDLLSILKLEQEMMRALEFDLNIEPWTRNTYARAGNSASLTRQNMRQYLLPLSNMKKELSIKSKSPKVSKSIMNKGEAVYVTSKEGVLKRGMIKACKEYEAIDGYGPRRTYNILFDNGDCVHDIEDYQVILEQEYTLSKRVKESEWKGVKHVCDEDSNDPWASEVGWYTVNIEGVEEAFEHCQTALMAYDVNQAQTKGDDLQESDLNLPKDWSIYFKAKASGKSRDLQMYGATLREQLPLTACLFASYKRIQNPTMKTIWAALVLSSEPNTMLQGFNLGFMYKYAYINYLDGNLAKLKETLYVFALWHICIQNHINTQRICRLFIAAKGNLDDFLSMVPLLRKVYESSTSVEGMLNYLQANKPESSLTLTLPQDEYIIIQCTNGYTTERNPVCCNAPLKQSLTKYADNRGTSVKSLRVKHNGKTLFISSIGKKTPLDLGIKEDDILEITIMQPTPTEASTKEEPKQHNTKKGKNKKSKKHKKSKKKRAQPLVIQKTEAELRGEHSKLLGKVYEEAEPTFKEIRQKLNALNLERTKPKQRTSPTKATKPVEVVDNPLGDDQLGGKAGKAQFIIQVGEVSNLYKTTKPSSSGRGSRRDDIMIDLHGLSAEEAVYRLDKHLPDWIETAMKGTYPFVIPVKIVCGGGSQILSEVVENWIKQNDHVANAPKNMYS